MVRKLLSVLRNQLAPSACVLMYHRIAEPPADIWDIAVSPGHFEQHVQLLKKTTHVVSAAELVAALARKKVRRNTIAITFDDGYADNFLVAKPILDQYNLPATFFITSQTIGGKEEFWWDELENIFLFADHLPPAFAATVAGSLIQFNLGEETTLSADLRQRHQRWNANEQAPPTLRCALFLHLWQRLKPLSYGEQQQHLQGFRAWAKLPPSTRPDYRSMSLEQVQRLGASQLHDVGVHTVSHPALAFHPKEFQTQEVLANQLFLAQATDKPIRLVAYPYGNYNHDTIALVREAGFQGAFTTELTRVKNTSNPYRLGRFQVQNLPAQAFGQQLRNWQKP